MKTSVKAGRVSHKLFFFAGFLTVSINLQALPDPTRPYDYLELPEAVVLEELPQEVREWTVNAIRISGEQRSAIINGRLVQEGGQLESATVKRISPGEVQLDYDGQQIIITLLPEPIKRPVRKKSGTGF